MKKEKDLSYIHAALQPFAVPVSSLVLDPKNARKHNKKNMDAVRASLEKFGQVLPIIARKQDNVIMVGNGRATIFKENGWKHIACLFTDLPEAEARMLAIADNRTGELAQWDYEALQTAALELGASFPDIELPNLLYGFDIGDLEPILRAEFVPAPVDGFGEDQEELDKLRVARGKLTVAGDVKKYAQEVHALLTQRNPAWKKKKLTDVIVYVLKSKAKKLKQRA